jgi:hypothetical protein
MTPARFAKTHRVQFLMLVTALAMGPLVLALSGDSQAGTRHCDDSGSNCPSCNSSGGGVYCSDPIQGFLPGVCAGTGDDCSEPGTWDCGTVILCLNDQPLFQPCGTRDICIP